VWILLLVYKTGLVEQIDDLHPLSNVASLDSAVQDSASRGWTDEASWLTQDARDTAEAVATSSTVGAGSHENQEELWKSLSANHWPMLFAYYNISLTGRCMMLILCPLFCQL